jgi:hypothetical protein
VISCAELVQNRVENNIQKFDFKNCLIYTKFIIAETGISKKPLGSKIINTSEYQQASRSDSWKNKSILKNFPKNSSSFHKISASDREGKGRNS